MINLKEIKTFLFISRVVIILAVSFLVFDLKIEINNNAI
jgi:hypothetical protein